ncbi:hypothetical protein HHI36_011683 [Cryptolaemus montrouzieri]|uniref:Uncharacterized protein n=1 Tax=Cryptolaemus montrouzieri TaxID=559131 RepID=A0ABD2MMC7_9CUCU
MKLVASDILLVWITLGAVYSFEYGEYERQPIFLTASVGGWVLLSCDIDFPETMPIPFKLYWNKNERTIFTYYKGVITSNEPYVGRLNLVDPPQPRYDTITVNLTSIRESDDGWFQCKVTFPNRTPNTMNRNGTWFHVSVNGGNLLEVPPINQTIMEGEEARLTCLPKDNAMKVIWYKDAVAVKDYQEMTHRTWTEEDGTLVIKPTQMEDNGEYECEVIHESGERQAARAFLDVQFKAKVLYAPPEIHLPFGRAAIIDCHFKANPPLTNLNWEKDGFLYDPYNIPGVFYKKNGSLLISKVDESHNGRYTCTPFNKLGTQGPSPPMNVVVQKPPVFVASPNNMYIRKLGEPIEIPCDARDGNNGHRPTVVWYKKDGTSLPMGRYEIKDGNLSIYNVQEEDRGLYVCSVTNKASTITAETELLVENIPSSAPYNLTGITSSHSVYLKWWAGRQRVNVNYSIWYKPVESKEWKTYYVPRSSYLDATIENLDPGREYEFMVLCRDERGEGLFSKAIKLWTKKSDGREFSITTMDSFMPPVGFPRNVTVTPTYKGFQVSWLPPEYGLENLKFYVVRCTQGVEDYPLVSHETRNISHLISDLPEGNQYGIQIIAVSYDDQQAISEKVSIKIPEYRKPSTT